MAEVGIAERSLGGDAREWSSGSSDTDGVERARRRMVLVVEDDLDEWKLYGKILWYNGFDVLHAADGEEALRMAHRYAPDLVLLDLMLPGRDGLEVCRELMRHEETSNIPVVVLTGRRASEFERELREAGCARYLEKPISPARVVSEVCGMIGVPPAAGLSPRPRKYSRLEDEADSH